MTVEFKLEEAFVAHLNLTKAELRPQQVEPSNLRPFELISRAHPNGLINS